MRHIRHPKRNLRHPSLHQPHIRFRLERWLRFTLYGVCGLLISSGVAWLIAHYFLRIPSEFGETIHPLESWSMKLHGGVAMIAIFFIGSLLNNHMRRAHQARRNLYSGWTIVLFLTLLITSGYVLYYFASESNRPLWSTIHWGLGLFFPIALTLHIFLGRCITHPQR